MTVVLYAIQSFRCIDFVPFLFYNAQKNQMVVRWWRIKMFNAKLMTANMMKKLRINVLVSACPSRSAHWFSASFSALAGGASGTTLLTQGVMSCVTASGFNLIPVILAVGTLPRLLFQGVRPVILSISPSMILESCALNAGSLSGLPMGLVWAGGTAPLPLLPPLPPLPCSDHLGSVVVDTLHPLIATPQYKIQSWLIGQSCGVDNMWCFLLWRLLHLNFLLTEFVLSNFPHVVLMTRGVPWVFNYVLLLCGEAFQLFGWNWRCQVILVIWEVVWEVVELCGVLLRVFADLLV